MNRGVIFLLVLPALILVNAPTAGGDTQPTKPARIIPLGPTHPLVPISRPDSYTAFPVDILARLRIGLTALNARSGPRSGVGPDQE